MELTVEVSQADVTADETATVEASIANAAESEVTSWPAYFKGSSEEHGTPGILLISERSFDVEPDYAPDCWEREEPAQETLYWSSEDNPTETVAPGESTTERLLVVADPTVEDCLPPGTYRFEQGHEIRGTSFDWGFTLVVSDGTEPG